MPIPSTVTMTPSPTMVGSVTPPGDKSISHRALLLSALGEGTSTINGLSRPGDEDDHRATRRIHGGSEEWVLGGDGRPITSPCVDGALGLRELRHHHASVDGRAFGY